MKNLIIVVSLLAFTTIAFAAPIDFDNLHVASTAFGLAAYESVPRLMAAYNNKIYFILSEDGSVNPSKVYCYDPSDALSNTANHSILAETTGRFVTLRKIDGLLYFSNDLGNVYSYDGTTLTEMSGTPFSAGDFVSSIEEFKGDMYFGTWTSNIFRYNGSGYEQVYGVSEDRSRINDMVAWQKDGYLYISVGHENICCPPTGYVIRSNSGDASSWETVFQGFWDVSLFMPTLNYLYAGVIDTAYGYGSSVRRSSDGLSFPVINQSSGQYKQLWGSLYYDGIAYVFVNQWGGSYGYKVIDENGTVSLVPNQSWTLTHAVELNGEVYALASSAPHDSLGSLGPADVYLITTVPEPPCEWVLLDGELNIPRHALTGEALDGYIYAIGGVVNPGSPSDAQNAVSKYDPATDSWALVASMPTARHSLSSAVIDGYIYAVGGHVANSRSENQRYNGTLWESKASVYARSGPGVAAYNGELYVFGGNHYATMLSRFDIYNPTTNTWRIGGNMPLATEPWRAITLGDKIYVNVRENEQTKKIWCYDPVADTWDTSIPLMNVPRGCPELQAVNGRIYAIGGSNASDGYLSSVESWAPGEASWRMEPSLNVARSGFASAVIGNDIYVFGGYNGGDLGSIEVLTICEPTLLRVPLDIKPGSCPNPLNVKSKGVLPVAILASEDFDVNAIDIASIRLAGVAPIRSNYEDVATPVSDGNECDCNTAGPDGYTDLTLKFKTREIVEALLIEHGELAEDDVLVLTLTGELSDATPIEGADCVVVVGKVPKSIAAKITDVNEDGVVNVLDMAMLARSWLESSVEED